jgi:pimeloyl-ACP methyl ester carboxylesterase
MRGLKALYLAGILFLAGCGGSARLQAEAVETVVVADPAVARANAEASGGIGYRSGWFGKGDQRLHYVEAGTGPLVILYHGFPSFWYAWFDQMEALKLRYRVVAVDGRGAGLSAKPDSLDAYRIERLAGEVDALARHLAGDNKFVLIGHDWGAALAFAYAQANPRRLHAVIGLGAPPYNVFLDLVRSNEAQQQRSQYMPYFRGLTPAMLDAGIAERIAVQAYAGLLLGGHLTVDEGDLFKRALVGPKAMNSGINWYRANIPSFGAIDNTHHWPAGNPPIDVPALLVWGDADRTFVEDAIARTQSAGKDVTVVRLPGVGHWTTMEQPALATKSIEAFLCRTTASCRRSR